MIPASSIILGPSLVPMGLAAMLAAPFSSATVPDAPTSRSGKHPNPNSKSGRIRSVMSADRYMGSDVIYAYMKEEKILGKLTRKGIAQLCHSMVEKGFLESQKNPGGSTIWRLTAKGAAA